MQVQAKSWGRYISGVTEFQDSPRYVVLQPYGLADGSDPS